MRNKFVLILIALATAIAVAPASAVLSASSIPAVFDELLKVPALSNPAMILIDGTTGEVVYQRNANSQRKPASVMKILSGVATLKYLDSQASFSTSISLGIEDRTLVIQGSFDPWISLNHSVARKMDRESLPYLASHSLSALTKANGGSLKGVTVLYSGLYSQDVTNLKSLWAKVGFKPTMKAVSGQENLLNAGSFAVSDTSPKIYEILDFTLKWSDNLLAERLARLSSRAAGNSFSDEGVSETFDQILIDFEIDPSRLVVVDASGLSKKNRVTAAIVGQLLYKVRKDERFNIIYNSLPVGGVSGTLRSRFLATAPNAIGLVRAKTGTLNGTVTLAGYVESTNREYVFVTLADDIAHGNSASNKARNAIDRILGRIAAPNIPTEISEAPPEL